MPPRIRPHWPATPKVLPRTTTRTLTTLPACTLRRHALAAPSSRTTLSHTQTRGMKSIVGTEPRWERYNISAATVPKAQDRMAILMRKEHTTPHRTGILVRKKGMSSMFDPETGAKTAVTVLQLDRCQIVGHKTFEKHGYYACEVGYGWKNWKHLSKAELGIFSEREVAAKEYVREFRVRKADGLLPIGTPLHPSWFKVGQLVDTRAKNKGKGFAGVMKRHGMSGQPASHGQSKTHRQMGSSGGGQGSGSRVHPGKRMPGRMGNEFHTVQHLRIMKVDDENGLIVVKGAVAGPKEGLVQIYDSKKRQSQVEALGLPTSSAETPYADDSALQQAAKN